MTMIKILKILDKEKDYLLSINAKQFVNNLKSKNIFYELVEYDLRNQLNKGFFNNITLIGVYNVILNLIGYNFYEGLNTRHCKIYNKQNMIIKIDDLWLKIYPINFLNKDEDKDKEYEYLFATSSFKFNLEFYNNSLTVKDKIDKSLIKLFGNIDHAIKINDTQMTNDFLPKMLILYQDFADNIPI